MKRAIFFAFLGAIFSPAISFAQGFPTIPLNLAYPKFGPFDLAVNQSLPEIIGFLYYFIVGIAGLAAFVMLVWGGIQWLTSGAIPSQAIAARDKLRNAVLGLLLVLSSFLIVQVLNPDLTVIGITTLSNPCSSSAPPAKCTVPTSASVPAASLTTAKLTANGSQAKHIPYPAAPQIVTMAWNTNLSPAICSATTETEAPHTPSLTGIWTNSNLPGAGDTGTFDTGSHIIDFAFEKAAGRDPVDGTTLIFKYNCNPTLGGSAVRGVSFLYISSTAPGPAPLINYFEVRDSSAGTPWPGMTGTLDKGTDFPGGGNPEFRWDADATSCWGENRLLTAVGGSTNGTRTLTWTGSPQSFRLVCHRNGMVHAAEIIINE